MKIRVRKSTTFISMVFMMAGLIALAFFSVSQASSPVQAMTEGGHLVTVHDRGQETTFVTNEDTLRAAFTDNGIVIGEKDAVEPSLDDKLVASDYQVNIYRARPVTVVDGAIRKKVVTPYQSADRIVADAGISLYPEDETKLTQSSDIVGDGAGLELQVIRAIPVNFDLYGTVTTVRTQAKTVGDMLNEKDVLLGETGRASVSLTTPIIANMTVKVWREGVQTITVEEDITFDTKEIKDADQPVGYQEVQTTGANGKRTVTYQIEIRDGVEVSRDEIASLQTVAPVTQVEVVGVKGMTLYYTGGGTKTEWLAASNIAESDWGYADYIVSRESSWNPNSVNASSGACGLAQALPCSKVPGNPYDPIDSLNWMNGYVTGRYGGWQGAYNFWIANNWY